MLKHQKKKKKKENQNKIKTEQNKIETEQNEKRDKKLFIKSNQIKEKYINKRKTKK